MRQQLLIICCVIACDFVSVISAQNYYYYSGDKDSSADEAGSRRRLGIMKPCMGFIQDCPSAINTKPRFSPVMAEPNGLSPFANDWIHYTCCQIVTVELPEIISTTWMWLQACQVTISMATTQRYALDRVWARENSPTTYPTRGPLATMKQFCPPELEGGKLTEWVVSTFFPVIETYNSYFNQSFNSTIKCNDAQTKKETGSVSVLLIRPQSGKSFGHLSMILHDNNNLELPPPRNNLHFVSFYPLKNGVGTMITGTTAHHDGFGNDLARVNDTVTLHNVDVTAMQNKWQEIKTHGQMFDLLEKNCARIVLEVLHEGMPGCTMPLEPLWTPKRAFNYVKQVADTKKYGSEPQLSLEKVHANQIIVEDASVTIENGVPMETVIASVTGSVLGTFVLSMIVAVVIIFYIKGQAEAKLEDGLAKLLLSAISDHDSNFYLSGPASKVKGNSVAPKIKAGAAVMGSTDTNHDGATDYEEFRVFSAKRGVSAHQSKILWNDLNKNHDDVISRDEWAEYIDGKPKLHWLISRLKSVAPKAAPAHKDC